jgi:intracellular septation protein A
MVFPNAGAYLRTAFNSDQWVSFRDMQKLAVALIAMTLGWLLMIWVRSRNSQRTESTDFPRVELHVSCFVPY